MGGHIATSGCRSLSQSFGATFFELVVIENLTVAALNDHIICGWRLGRSQPWFLASRGPSAAPSARLDAWLAPSLLAAHAQGDRCSRLRSSQGVVPVSSRRRTKRRSSSSSRRYIGGNASCLSENNFFDQLNFKYESHESRLYCGNSKS